MTEKHIVRPAMQKERVDCCGDLSPCNVSHVCSCGKHGCIFCIKTHLFNLHLREEVTDQ